MLQSSLRPALRSAGGSSSTVWRCPGYYAPFHSSGAASAAAAGPKKMTADRTLSKKNAAPSAAEKLRADPEPTTRIDPHQMASEFIKSSPDTRIQGTEALASMTPEQRMRNYVTAAGLVGFVTWVWWYSMTSVGRADGGFEDLRAEAEEARAEAERRAVSEQEAAKLADLDVTMANLTETESGEVGDGVVVAVAAPDDVAREEEERNIAAKGKGEAKARPLWKKVVFFWRRD